MITRIDVRARGGAPVKNGRRRAYRTLRKLTQIDAIGWHHWGVHVSIVPFHGETREEALIRRARSVPYHITAFTDCFVIAWPFELVTMHGNELNHRSIGVALAGRFPEFESQRTSEHDSPLDFCATIDAIVRFLREAVPSLKYSLTHSQVAAKPSDPGELAARIVSHVGGLVSPPIVSLPDYSIAPGQPWAPEWRAP